MYSLIGIPKRLSRGSSVIPVHLVAVSEDRGVTSNHIHSDPMFLTSPDTEDGSVRALVPCTSIPRRGRHFLRVQAESLQQVVELGRRDCADAGSCASGTSADRPPSWQESIVERAPARLRSPELP